MSLSYISFIYNNKKRQYICTPSVLFYLSHFSKNKLADDKYSKTEVVLFIRAISLHTTTKKKILNYTILMITLDQEVLAHHK
jgi:hypothetical protein